MHELQATDVFRTPRCPHRSHGPGVPCPHRSQDTTVWEGRHSKFRSLASMSNIRWASSQTFSGMGWDGSRYRALETYTSNGTAWSSSTRRSAASWSCIWRTMPESALLYPNSRFGMSEGSSIMSNRSK